MLDSLQASTSDSWSKLHILLFLQPGTVLVYGPYVLCDSHPFLNSSLTVHFSMTTCKVGCWDPEGSRWKNPKVLIRRAVVLTGWRLPHGLLSSVIHTVCLWGASPSDQENSLGQTRCLIEAWLLFNKRLLQSSRCQRRFLSRQHLSVTTWRIQHCYYAFY